VPKPEVAALPIVARHALVGAAASYVGELASKVATSEKQGQQFYLVAQPAERRWCWRGYVAHVDALYDRALVTGCQPTTAPHDAECAN